MEMPELYRLNQLADEREELYASIRLFRYLTPLNLKQEKARCIDSHAAGSVYNPFFEYQSAPIDWQESLWKLLQDLQPASSIWEEWICQDIEDTLESMRMAETHDPDIITSKTLHSYGHPTEDLVSYAIQELEKPLDRQQDDRQLLTHDVIELMKSAIQSVNIEGWSVVEQEPMSARMSVRSSERQVKIRSDEFFNRDEVNRLLVHEIGTHVFRTANGNLQPLKLFKFGCNYTGE